ncbi:hypothetical protein [Paenibacillus abyssi]|uniref:Uncharacterized protein n=1 Tax=Paenibacillus abyssi TaxID=1340531 RepID=A0A917D5H8_9BACL|nr:hypothetical protein [Paenibacillus abyssi]GGG11412.1 hypothetical protein GCM10010916_30320 [Paenibacillus abyssi]
MNRDFIQPKSLDGELKLSHKNYDYGVTVSTKELIFHKPHINYHIKFEDLISIVPFEIRGKKKFAIENRRGEITEFASTSTSANPYRLHVRSAVMHNRSGMFKLGTMQFVFPIHANLLQIIAEHSGLNQF